MVIIRAAGAAPAPFGGYVIQLNQPPATVGGFVHVGVTVPGFARRRITLRGSFASYHFQIDRNNPDITGEIKSLVQDIEECGEALPQLTFEILEDY